MVDRRSVVDTGSSCKKLKYPSLSARRILIQENINASEGLNPPLDPISEYLKNAL